MARHASLTILPGVIAAGAVTLALAGCSGGGSSTSAASGASVKALASGDVSGALTTKQWMDVFYRGLSGFVVPAGVRPTGLVRPRGVARPRSAVRPQDAWVWTEPDPAYPNSDGSRTWSIWFDDTSGYAFIAWPDGHCKLLAWGPYFEYPNGVDAQVDTYEWWRADLPIPSPPLPASLDALNLRPVARTSGSPAPPPPPIDLPGYTAGKMWYTQCTDFAARNDSHQVYAGAGDIPGGFHIPLFTLDRTTARDAITATYSDGTGLAVAIPLRGITNVAFYAPDFSKGAAGSFISPGVTQAFSMTGVSYATQQADGSYGHWLTLTVASPDGTTAKLDLTPSFAGSGQLARFGQLLGTLAWDDDADGTLRQVGMDAVAVSPSAAARNFAVERFIYSAAAMGPGGSW